MTITISLLSKAQTAVFALEWSLPLVHSQVVLHIAKLVELAFAYQALEYLVLPPSVLVHHEQLFTALWHLMPFESLMLVLKSQRVDEILEFLMFLVVPLSPNSTEHSQTRWLRTALLSSCSTFGS